MRILASCCALLLWLAPALSAEDHQHGIAAGEKLGTVHFQTSCTAAAQPVFDRAAALLHSFEFARAVEAFDQTLAADPSCTIAWWGIALSRWGNPFAAGLKPAAQMQLGAQAIAAAAATPPKTERERGYVAAAAKLYADYERTPQTDRLRAYRDAMAALAARYPQDDEATIFYALSLAIAADPADKSYAAQLEGGAILEKLFASHPDHPGLAHYIIHAYDVPPLAGRALPAARRYATIAPSAPHALHMPSHTFTRVGSWQESIDTNIASAAAARRADARAEELHAMDYMAYAYLQTGQDRAVQALMGRIPELAAGFDPGAVSGAAPGSAGVFALAAIPARWALERRDWKAALALEPRPGSLPHTEAMTYFTRALGAAHAGSLAEARRMTQALADSRNRLAASNEAYWAGQVAIQYQGAVAFVALAEGRTAEALALMREAAAREDATEKNAVTPGPIAPARELLAEMLLDLKQPAQALTEFRATLEKEPNRFRAVYGAAKAASLAGDPATARNYYGELLRICERADSPGRSELAEARSFIASQPAS
jgi:tetratricopeptide (TPR) repeat protein